MNEEKNFYQNENLNWISCEAESNFFLSLCQDLMWQILLFVEKY